MAEQELKYWLSNIKRFQHFVFIRGVYCPTRNFLKLLEILNPIIKSESVWSSHALYLLAEYFYSKNQKQKSKEFFNQIINSKKPNPDIVTEAQKRLNRDLSD